MKKFNRILEQYVRENESLTRIRLKVDPKDTSGIDFRDFDGYEGYILKEGKYFNILIEGMDFPIMQVPFSIIKVIDIKDKDTFNRVRVAAIEKLNNIKDITPELINKFKACNSVDFFEEFLKEEGLSESDIKDIYKNYIFADTFTEAVNWGNVANSIKKAYQKGRTIGKVGLGVLFPTYGAEQLLKKLNEPIKQTPQDQQQQQNKENVNKARSIINKIPSIDIDPAKIQLSTIFDTITSNPNFGFEKDYNGYSNPYTRDIFVFSPNNASATKLKVYSPYYVKNDTIHQAYLNTATNYLNNIFPGESPMGIKITTKSIFTNR